MILIAVALYSIAYWWAYLETPMGQKPVMDGAENLAIAELLANGELPREPFYRAMVYPFVLSIFYRCGVPEFFMPIVAGFFGLICHSISTLLVYELAFHLSGTRKGGILSAILFGFNPVLIYYAVDPLDITLATTLFLAGLWCLFSSNYLLAFQDFSKNAVNAGDQDSSLNVNAKHLRLFLCGVFIALAILTRPHLLPVLGALPVCGFLIQKQSSLKRKIDLQGVAIPIFAGGLCLLCFGCFHLYYTGSWRILPWQGAYNLWAANKPSSNGKYFKQIVFFPEKKAYENTARLESEYLYKKDTQANPERSELKADIANNAELLSHNTHLNIDLMSQYWRKKFIDYVFENPKEWVFLMFKKTYFLSNNYEQYNNKTFSFYKTKMPLLNWNPIHWGVLWILGITGVHFYGRGPHKGYFYAIWILVLAYAVGFLLFYTSGRFRVPLIPLFCILAASWGYFKISTLSRRDVLILTLCALAVSTLTYSNFWDVSDRSTYIQDEILWADACAQLNEDEEAYILANRALERDPLRQDALRIVLISYYNMQIEGNSAVAKIGDWRSQQSKVNLIEIHDATLDFVCGIYFWKWGEKDRAVSIWKRSVLSYPEMHQGSVLALILSGNRDWLLQEGVDCTKKDESALQTMQNLLIDSG